MAHKILHRLLPYFVRDNYNSFMCSKKVDQQRKEYQAKHYHHDKIHVAFLCLQGSVWNKTSPLVKELSEDARFAVRLLVLPLLDNNRADENGHGENNPLYDKLKKEYGERVYPVSKDNNLAEFLDFEADYVFYPTPYITHYPNAYQISTISRYAKPCYIDYAFDFFVDMIKSLFDLCFYRYLYFNFLVQKENKTPVFLKMHLAELAGYQKNKVIGSLSLAEMANWPASGQDMWKSAGKRKRIIWTPRWTDDVNFGAGNFLNYYIPMLEFAKEHPNTFWVIRPHPLTFQYFVNAGKITQEQVDRYVDEIERQENVVLDTGGDYLDTFASSDILVADYSTVVAEYALTQKPIVFCPPTGSDRKKLERQMTKGFCTVLEGAYWINSFEDVCQSLKKLLAGEDPLQDARSKSAGKLKQKYVGEPAKIRDAIIKDFRG